VALIGQHFTGIVLISPGRARRIVQANVIDADLVFRREVPGHVPLRLQLHDCQGHWHAKAKLLSIGLARQTQSGSLVVDVQLKKKQFTRLILANRSNQTKVEECYFADKHVIHLIFKL